MRVQEVVVGATEPMLIVVAMAPPVGIVLLVEPHKVEHRLTY